MDLISKLTDVDPVFVEVVKALYPEIDPRELWDLSKNMPDQNGLHVNTGMSTRKKVALGAGLGIGLGADLIAVKHTGPDAIKATKAVVQGARAGGGLKAALKPHIRPIGEGALTGVNLAAGIGAGKEIFGNKKNKVSKSEIIEAFEPILKARKDGTITTEQALGLIDGVEKGFGSLTDNKVIGGAIKHFKSGEDLTGYLQRGQAQVSQVHAQARKGKAIIGTGVAATALTVGHKRGNAKEIKAQRNNLLSKSAGALVPKVQALAGVSSVNPDMPKKVTPSTPKITAPKNISKLVDYEFTGTISKMDEDKRQVFGWASLSTVDGQEVIDLQDDHVALDEIEKAAYDYVVNSRKGGDMHTRIGDEPLHTSDMIESMIVTPEKLAQMGVPADVVTKMHTGWWVGYQVNDDKQWNQVKKGERTGFSIHGTGRRVERV